MLYCTGFANKNQSSLKRRILQFLMYEGNKAITIMLTYLEV